MVIGHLAVGFAAKRVAPRTDLGLLMAASAAVDIVYFVLLLMGWEDMRIAPGLTAYSPLAFDHYPFPTASMTNNSKPQLLSMKVPISSRSLPGRSRGGNITRDCHHL